MLPILATNTAIKWGLQATPQHRSRKGSRLLTWLIRRSISAQSNNVTATIRGGIKQNSKKEHLRDLGVTMSNNTAFQDHISNIETGMDLMYISNTRQNSHAIPVESTGDSNPRLL